MRIVLSDFMSLDGVVQAPGSPDEDTDGGFAHGGWSMRYFDAEAMGASMGEAMESARGLLFGRRTWRVMADAWPSRAGDPFADNMNALPKYVASTTLTADDMEWNTTLLPSDDVFGAVGRLRKEGDGDLVVMGSANFAQQLVARNLVDEYRVMIEPVLLGGGKRLFPDDGGSRPLTLVSTTTASTGVIICVYRPADAE